VFHLIAAVAGWALAMVCVTSAVAQGADVRPVEVEAVGNRAAKTSVAIRLPKEDTVSYKGIANFDGAGAGALSMLYPVPNAAGLLVAVLTHAVIAESAQSRQRRELQEAADRVLVPYRSTLTGVTHKELVTRALRHSTSSDVHMIVDMPVGSDASFVVDPALIFYMTQDQRALVLHAVFAISGRDAQPRDPSNHAVRVVGRPRELADARAFWTADHGEKLRHESTLLLAHALDLALSEVRSPAGNREGREMTFRYLEGVVEKMERARLVSEMCDRAVIRTLRGELMSVPLRAAAAAAGACEHSP